MRAFRKSRPASWLPGNQELLGIIYVNEYVQLRIPFMDIILGSVDVFSCLKHQVTALVPPQTREDRKRD